jgi:hypothetical protein
MDRNGRSWTAGYHARPLTLMLSCGVAGLVGLTLAGCQLASAASRAPSPAATASARMTASASPGLPVPGTHQSTRVYRIWSPVSMVIVISHVGNVTVTGGSGSATSVTEQVTYSSTPPVTARTVSDGRLTLTYHCRAQLICGVAYQVRMPRTAAVQVTAGAGAIRLAGLAGRVTARADVGPISATGLAGASVSLTTGVGGISAAFAVTPAMIQALTTIGAITLSVPDSTSYRVSADARAGKATISIPQSSLSAHAITATTDIGTILIK